MAPHDVTTLDFDVQASSIPLRQGEAAWTGEDLKSIFLTLTMEADRLQADLVADAAELDRLMADRAAAGEDQADTGSATLEREQELALNQNLSDMLRQCNEALYRIETGRYGRCDSCNQAIGRARLQAYPRAVLCVACKQREERRG